MKHFLVYTLLSGLFSIFSGCTLLKYKVTLYPVSSTFVTPDRKLAGSVSIDLTDLGITNRTANYESFIGSTIRYDVDCHGALSKSIMNFANQYFQNVCELGSKDAIEYDFLLKVKSIGMRWWADFGMTSFFEMKMLAALYGRDGSILEEVTVTGLGKGMPRDRTTLSETRNTAEVLMSKIGEQAMKDALEKAFGQLVSSPAVHRYEDQLKIKKFLERTEPF